MVDAVQCDCIFGGETSNKNEILHKIIKVYRSFPVNLIWVKKLSYTSKGNALN